MQSITLRLSNSQSIDWEKTAASIQHHGGEFEPGIMANDAVTIELKGKQALVKIKTLVMIGRTADAEHTTIVCKNQTISTRHCWINRDGVINDEGSTNGTFFDSAKVSWKKGRFVTHLTGGSRLSLGQDLERTVFSGEAPLPFFEMIR